MEKPRKAITYIGLILLLAVMVYIIYANIQDRRQVVPTPIRGAATPTNVHPLGAMSKDMAAAMDAISSERMFATIDALSSFQYHSGWRGAGTAGEKGALNYVQSQLESMLWLSEMGMEIEREHFNVFLATEDHTSRVFFSDGSKTYEIPADAIRGSRDNPDLVKYVDSDGVLSDQNANPVTVKGSIVRIPDDNELNTLSGSDQSGRILLVDYSVVVTTNPLAMTNAEKILGMNPAAIILVTHNSNVLGEDHGVYIGDGGGVFQRLDWKKNIPLLFIEIENLKEYGVTDWDGFGKLTQAQVIYDVDVLNPAESSNLIVHIPGKNTNRPVLISAHIDSANSPGALDDGSGSALLLEIATILNQKMIQPEVDLYLAWYGSEEIGLYGSAYFTTTHSDLLNKLQANVQIDCLSHPLDGLPSEVMLMFSHTNTTNLLADPLAKYLINRANDLNIDTDLTYWPFASDNGSLSAFNIPNLDIIYQSQEMDEVQGGVWYSGHFHDPYDTSQLAREEEEPYKNMARMALTVALITPSQVDFVEHKSDKKVVFLSNHTESPHMTPAVLTEFSLSLIKAGYSISVVPYGKTLKSSDIEDANLVVVLPTYDYPLTEEPYDTAWTQDEAEIVDAYVQNGGKVLVVNSSHRLKFLNYIMEENEDWADLNALTQQWGFEFIGLGSSTETLNVEGRGLMEGLSTLKITPDTAVYFKTEAGIPLAGIKSKAYLAQIRVGKGEVVVLGDLTVLGESEQGLINPQFAANLANWE